MIPNILIMAEEEELQQLQLYHYNRIKMSFSIINENN